MIVGGLFIANKNVIVKERENDFFSLLCFKNLFCFKYSEGNCSRRFIWGSDGNGLIIALHVIVPLRGETALWSVNGAIHVFSREDEGEMDGDSGALANKNTFFFKVVRFTKFCVLREDCALFFCFRTLFSPPVGNTGLKGELHIECGFCRSNTFRKKLKGKKGTENYGEK